MNSYLESLALRLAAGVARFDESLRQRHAAFLLAAQNPDGGFSGREGGSDLYYTGFALRGLSMLGELDGPVAARAAEYLRGRMSGQAPIVDFFSLLYGGALLKASSGIDLYAGLPDGWRDTVAAELDRFRRPDGGFAKTDEGQSSSTYYTFLVLLALEIIERPLGDREAMLRFVLSRQRDDGGFVEIGPMRRSGTNPTAAAVGILKILGGLDDAIRADVVEFLAERQGDEGGLAANTTIPLADVLSSFTGLLTLGDLGALDRLDLAAVRRYVLSMEVPSGGFRGGEWDGGTDVEYTFYGLGALALLASK